MEMRTQVAVCHENQQLLAQVVDKHIFVGGVASTSNRRLPGDVGAPVMCAANL